LDEGHPLFSLFLFIVNFKQENQPEVSQRKGMTCVGAKIFFRLYAFDPESPTE
jgi:hypothetical protein